MIKKIRVELLVFVLLLVGVFFSQDFDNAFYTIFSELNYGNRADYLKDFFVGITKLGESLWYFLIIFFTYLFLFILYKCKKLSLKKYLYFKNFCIYSFCYILIVGLITQVLKHIIGRPRPNYKELAGEYGFNFLTFDSELHSLPSGHTSTIISVAIIAGLLVPRLKVFFYFFASCIALSRVVVGAHYITDVFAGVLLAIIIHKVLNIFIENKLPHISPISIEIKNISLIKKSLIVALLFSIFLTAGFSLDVYFSSLFYYENSQFLIQGFSIMSILFRDIFLPFLLLYIFILPFFGNFFLIRKMFFSYSFSFKEIAFVYLAGITTLVILINILLKGLWGRVRPNDIVEFGGKDNFTPWYEFGGGCISNCSFVSGDASVGFMLVAFYLITKKNIYFYLSLFSGASLGLIRIMAGGHFLSDIVFSQIIVTAFISVLFVFYKKIYVK
tara:strand:+ start:4604 stop:5932 length:1329 start_codon:yes stop_codon:yes gene_type:complete